MDEAAEVAVAAAAPDLQQLQHHGDGDEPLLLPAPAEDGEVPTPNAPPSRPKRTIARETYECEESGDGGGSGSDSDNSYACSEPTAASASASASAAAAAAAAASATAQAQAHYIDTARAHERLAAAGIDSLDALANADERYDIDGFSCLYRGEAMLDALERAMGDLTIPIDPIGADLQQQRRLGNPDQFATVCLTQPEVRRGMLILLERNAMGWTREDVGLEVEALPGSGVLRPLTLEAIDGGLDAVHTWLDFEADGQHYGVKGLERCAPGSHGVWERHLPIMFYKLVEAAKRNNLGILISHFGQKAKCVHPPLSHCPPITAQRSAPAQRQRPWPCASSGVWGSAPSPPISL